MREFLIEIPHARQECDVARAGLVDDLGSPSYWGCEAGTHTTWIIAELAAEHEAWRLVPRLLRDTARVVPVVETRTTLDNRRRAEMLRKLGALLSLVVLFTVAAFAAAVAPAGATPTSPGACHMLDSAQTGLDGMDGSQGGKNMVPLVIASLGIGCTP